MKRKKTNISGLSQDLSKSITRTIEKEANSIILPLNKKKIGLSVSDSEEFLQLGFSETHQKDITIELTRYLLVNGAHIVYGGDLRKDGYTYALSELSFQYRLKEHHNASFYTNVFAWPIYNRLQNSDLADFKKNRVSLIKATSPKDVPANLRGRFVEPDTIENQVLWAKSMSQMRSEMVKLTKARISIGGRLSDYKGFFPGILEEAYLTIKSKQPLFLVGAFGGATNLVIRAIKGESHENLVNEIFGQFPGLQELYQFVGKTVMTQQLNEIFTKFSQMGLKGLSSLNGLSNDENEVLFDTNHFHEMIYYILIGLQRKL